MGLLKSGWMQPVVEEPTAPTADSESETLAERPEPHGAKALISDIPDDAFGHVLFWLPPLTNLAAARVAKQWRVRVAKYFGFGTDKGQFKGILRVVMHDLDDLVFDEVAGGEVPAELILQRDFGKNERRPLRFGTIEDLPPY